MLRELAIRPVVGLESDAFLAHVDHDAIKNQWMSDEFDVVIFSNENFILVDDPKRFTRAKELRDSALAAGFDVTTIIYLRPAVEWIPSMWAQYVKIGSLTWGTISLQEFVSDFDYSVILQSVDELRSEGSTIIRPYLRTSMGQAEGILDDFFDAVGLGSCGISIADIPDALNMTPSRRQTDLARVYNMNQRPGEAARRHHVELLNSFLRVPNVRDPEPSVAATTTRAQLQSISDRFADREAALTNGLVDSRLGLEERLAKAPDTYQPDVSDDAVDQYLQNMMILSSIDRLAER